MSFKKGMFGACICTIALVITAIGGFVLNVSEETRTATVYEQVADVTGLFDHIDTPEYIAYNPSTNYTGYSPSGSVTYTPSATANSYRYITQHGETRTATTTISSSSDYPADYGDFTFGESDYGYVMAPDVRFLWNGTIDFGTASTIWGNSSNGQVVSTGTPIENSRIHITRLSTVLSSLGVNDASRMDITIAQTQTYPVLFYAGDWTINTISDSDGYFNAYHAIMNETNSMPDRLTVSLASNLVTAYRGGTQMWQAPADSVGVLAWYRCQSGGYINPVSCSATLTATITYADSYGYMQPSAGVYVTELLSQNATTWANGYENGTIDLKVLRTAETSSRLPQSLTIVFDTAHNLGIQYNYDVYDGQEPGWVVHKKGGEKVQLGIWPAIQIHIDAQSGDITATPTADTDLTKTAPTTQYSVTIGDALAVHPITSLQIWRGTQPLSNFQITDTTVYLNTYNAVMLDPVLDISQYFPGYDDYRLNFYSFALLGESITINGQTCAVNRTDATITFTNWAGFSFTKKLANIYLTAEDGHTYLSFANDREKYDLGETQSTAVSFGGLWYFSSMLYQGTDGTETYWDWNLGGFKATSGECLLIFIGTIAGGILAYTAIGRGKLHIYDWLIIVSAVFLADAFLGV